MLEEGEKLPRPGHVGDLHEWAQQQDAVNKERLLARRDEINQTLFSMVDESARSQMSVLLSELEGIAHVQAGPGLADVFDGNAGPS